MPKRKVLMILLVKLKPTNTQPYYGYGTQEAYASAKYYQSHGNNGAAYQQPLVQTSICMFPEGEI